MEEDVRTMPAGGRKGPRVSTSSTGTVSTTFKAAFSFARGATEDLDMDDVEKKAMENRKATACTEYLPEEEAYEWRPLWGTTTSTLGVYGVGIELYFEFLFFMGIIFTIMFLLSMPLLAVSVQGSLIVDNPQTQDAGLLNRLLGHFSVANIGACREEACKGFGMARNEAFEQRPLSAGSSTKVSELTQALGTLDGIGLLILLSFGAWFQKYWIPRTKEAQDERHVTAADYAVEVIGLPRRLDNKNEHEVYEELLKEHFQGVLLQSGIKDDDAVQEVALIREYDGAIKLFMEQGRLLMVRDNVKALAGRALESGNQKEAEAQQNKARLMLNQINSIEKRLCHQADKEDKDREVCTAYVMFKTEAYKHAVLARYYKANFYLHRLFQDRLYRFLGEYRIRVQQACEPDDLFWENLDFSPCRHRLRKWLTILIAVCLLLACVITLIWFRSFKYANDTYGATEQGTFVIRQSPKSGDDECVLLCDFQFFSDAYCEAYAEITLPVGKSATDVQGNVDIGEGDCWKSPSCTNTTWAAEVKADKGKEDWIQIPMSADIGCFKFTQKSHEATKRLELYHCDSYNENFQTECIRYMDVKPDVPEMSQTNVNLPSGRLHPAPDTFCSQEVGLEAAKHAKDNSGHKQKDVVLNCFCAQQDLSDSTFRMPGGDTEAQEVCKEWIETANIGTAFYTVGICGVLILNQVLLVIFTALDNFSRYRTCTEQAKTQMSKVFFAQLANTGIATFVVSLNLRGRVAVPALSYMVGNGTYDDLTIAWWVQVGTSLFTTIVGQAVCVVLTPPAWAKVVDPLLIMFGKGDKITQAMLNELYMMPEFLVSLRTAETMNIIVCVVMYGGGMPLLYLVGILYCVCAYWVDKWTLLRASRKPPRYNEETVEAAVLLLPFAGLLHTVMTLWIFGRQEVFPSGWAFDGIRGLVEAVLNYTPEQYEKIMEVYPQLNDRLKEELFGEYVRARCFDFSRESCWLIFIVFCCFVAYHILNLFFSIFLKPCFGAFWLLFQDRVKTLRKKLLRRRSSYKAGPAGGCAAEEYAEAKLMAEKFDQLFSYKLEANSRYRAAYEALQYNPDEGMGMTQSFARVAWTAKLEGAAMWAGNLLDTAEQKFRDAENAVADKAELLVESCKEVFSMRMPRKTQAPPSRPPVHTPVTPAPQPDETEPQPCETEPLPCETEPQPCETEPQPCETEPQPCETAPQPRETEPQPCEMESAEKDQGVDLQISDTEPEREAPIQKPPPTERWRGPGEFQPTAHKPSFPEDTGATCPSPPTEPDG